jgi:Zn-dependent protease
MNRRGQQEFNMFSSMRLGTLMGIPIRVHFTFYLLLGVFFLVNLVRGGVVAALASLILITAVFGLVVLHELGHAMAARAFGIRTHDVTLLPIGGVARLERMPREPRQEFWIALAGPAVNLAIAGLLGIWLFATGGATASTFAGRLMVINLALVFFNLLPAFPMDGGRVLRAVLARRMGHVRATDIAAGVGKGMALLFGVAGLFLNPMLIFIALFVWFGASQEQMMARARSHGAFFEGPVYRHGSGDGSVEIRWTTWPAEGPNPWNRSRDWPR